MQTNYSTIRHILLQYYLYGRTDVRKFRQKGSFYDQEFSKGQEAKKNKGSKKETSTNLIRANVAQTRPISQTSLITTHDEGSKNRKNISGYLEKSKARAGLSKRRCKKMIINLEDSDQDSLE